MSQQMSGASSSDGAGAASLGSSHDAVTALAINVAAVCARSGTFSSWSHRAIFCVISFNFSFSFYQLRSTTPSIVHGNSPNGLIPQL